VRKGVRSSATISAALAALFAVGGWLRSGSTVESVAWFAVAGAVLGAIAAPELLERGTFRHPARWQMFFSVLGCVLFAVAWSVPPEGYALAVVGGAILGYIAPVWIKYIQVP
jgi:hypothetical protein